MTLELLGWSFPLQVVINGVAIGLGYSVIAAGIVLIYRSSGIVNFAQAAMGAFGVASFVVLFQNYSLPYPLAAALGVAGAVIIGVVTELLVVRRLFDSSRVVLLIATVGVAQLISFLIMEALPDVQGGLVPVAFDAGWANIDLGENLQIGARQTSVLLLVVPVLVGLGWFLSRTKMGLHIRAVADSPDNARLVGVSPKRVSTVVWGLAAGFAAYTQIVLAPIVTRSADELAGVSTVGLLLRALVIALAARMRSIPLVVVGGVVLGVSEILVSLNLNRNIGIFNAFLFAGVLVLVILLARAAAKDSDNAFTIGVRRDPIPEHLRSIWWIRHMSSMGMAVLLVAALIVPLVLARSSQYLVWTELLVVAVVAVSLSLLTGWAGQLSLGQFAFAGVGGLSMLAFTQGNPLGIGFPFVGELFSVSVQMPWLVALLMGTAIGVLFAVVVGLPALRVKGLFLAVTTLAFGSMATSWMFGRNFWSGGRPTISSMARERPEILGFDFVSPMRYYYLCLAFLVLAVVVVSQLRKTGSGRVMIAVRDNEPQTAAATVSVTKAKLSAFAVSGGLAAMAGGLYVYLLPGFNAAGSNSPFTPAASLQLVAIAIIGGIGTVAGPILGALWVLGLPAAFGAGDTVRLLTANIGLLILLLYFPGGLVQILYGARDAVLRWASQRVGAPEPPPRSAVSLPPRRRTDFVVPEDDRPWLMTQDVSVRFGGIAAVGDATIEVRPRELVGLIGTNGAGKSTLMNAISGFVPHTGRIELLGQDISELRSDRRHMVGLGRGFQDAKLFQGLTVRETVLVALEARSHSWLLPSMLALPPSPAHERVRRRETDEILDFLGMGPYGDYFVADLSTGMRRVVELACLIAADAKVLLLDEPTGGVAQRETEAFAPLIKRVQRELDAAVLVIEHDMPLIMSISDRVYCMEAGGVIAEGPPEVVRSDRAVIASYLGTDDRAIGRSDQISTEGSSAEEVAPR